MDTPLGKGQAVQLTQGQLHYISSVMRRSEGDQVAVFNGRDGEWQATIAGLSKKAGRLLCEEQLRQQSDGADLWLVFAPIRRLRTELVIEKATELGVSRIIPVQMQHSNSDRLRLDRLQLIATEAAEQSERLTVPTVEELQPLARLLENWPEGRDLICAFERSEAGDLDLSEQAAAVLIGPEGGFSVRERDHLRSLDFVKTISLGPLILRAETAAIAALALVQSRSGDWS